MVLAVLTAEEVPIGGGLLVTIFVLILMMSSILVRNQRWSHAILNAVPRSHILDVRLIGRDIGLPGRFVADHIKNEPPVPPPKNGRGKRHRGKPPPHAGDRRA